MSGLCLLMRARALIILHLIALPLLGVLMVRHSLVAILMVSFVLLPCLPVECKGSGGSMYYYYYYYCRKDGGGSGGEVVMIVTVGK